MNNSLSVAGIFIINSKYITNSIAFLAISDRYRTFFWRPFWVSEIHFRSHFWTFQIYTELFIFLYILLTKWPPAAIFDVRNLLSIAFLAISYLYGTFLLPSAILDVRKSLLIAFLTISDRSAILGVRNSLSIGFRRNFLYIF